MLFKITFTKAVMYKTNVSIIIALIHYYGMIQENTTSISLFYIALIALHIQNAHTQKYHVI
jgi:hypothetical protein